MGPDVLKQTLVPIVAIMSGLIMVFMPALIVYLVLQFRQRKAERVLETVKHLAERGLPVPRELLDPPRAAAPNDISQTARFRAITLLGVGIGLSLMFHLLGLAFLVGIGALLICIGIAQLIAVWIEMRSPMKAPSAPAAESAAEPNTRAS